jgi:hypothetical protein
MILDKLNLKEKELMIAFDKQNKSEKESIKENL